jgi:hypothetical protein
MRVGALEELPDLPMGWRPHQTASAPFNRPLNREQSQEAELRGQGQRRRSHGAILFAAHADCHRFTITKMRRHLRVFSFLMTAVSIGYYCNNGAGY